MAIAGRKAHKFVIKAKGRDCFLRWGRDGGDVVRGAVAICVYEVSMNCT